MGARKIASLANITGRSQPACLTDNTTHLVDCGNWSESASWTVPKAAVSGIYIAKLSRPDTGGASHIVLVVRDTPVNVTANTTFVVSYHTNTGNYSVNNGYFASAGVDNAPLHALASGVDGANGVYLYGSSAFPTQTDNASNY